MSGPCRSEVKAEPNLTPILDMVFQLITFFMLVINFKSAEMDLSLRLPVVGSARPVERRASRAAGAEHRRGQENPDGYLTIYGHAADMEEYIADESRPLCMAK